MLGYYNYTVILTYLGALSGFAGIISIWDGKWQMALGCLIFSGFCDMFDGKVAFTRERTPQEKRFGVQIDSLSDLVCFGLLPALIVIHRSNKSSTALVCGAAYFLCALIRLAWFNVDEEERQTREEGRREFYSGLPVTMSALLLPLYLAAGRLFELPTEKFEPLFLLCIAVAFLTPFHIRKPGVGGKSVSLLLLAAGLTALLAEGVA